MTVDPAESESPRKILMIVPYKARDLEGHALVAYHLWRRHGIEVVPTNGYGIERKLLLHRPDALVMDHLCWNFKAEQARLARSLGMKVVILPTEGLVQDYDGARVVVGSKHDAADTVNLFLSWGTYQRQAVLHQDLMEQSHTAVVGCSRFDFYREPYLKLIPSRGEFLGKLGVKNPDAPMILWCTNTPYFARDRKKIIARYTQRAGYTLDQIVALLDGEQRQFQEHSSLVMDLAQRHPDWNFVIKVHPAEWINPYVPLTHQASNVVLGYDAPIRGFLFHCDVLLQRNCTTSTEAWMLDKPVIDAEFSPSSYPVRAEFRAGSHLVQSPEEAEQAIEGYLAGMPIPAQQRQARASFIADFYHQIDGQAAARAAEAIADLLRPPSYDDSARRHKEQASEVAHARWKAGEDRRWPNRVKDLMGVSRDQSIRFWSRWKWLKRESSDNLGMFRAEEDTTLEDLRAQYERYDRLSDCSSSSAALDDREVLSGASARV